MTEQAPKSESMADSIEQDRAHLQRALELAAEGRGAVSPNPLVGAVIVRQGRVIGEGYHAVFGGPHAEVNAIADCRARGHDPAGATIYVTLEPCAHQGKQPPCSEAIIAAGIGRVVIGSDDPSPHADGLGPSRLRESGIAVEFADGSVAAASGALVQPFRKHVRTGRPLVALKMAMSLDGRTATASGDSRWITGARSRRLVHLMRADTDAVAVGIGTALRDDPSLTAREVPVVRQPTRVVFDSAARLPLDSQLVTSARETPVVVIAAPDADPARVNSLRSSGVRVISVEASGADQVLAALTELGSLGIASLLIEGGAGLAGSLLDAREVDELRVFIAPVLIGGADAMPVAAGLGAATIAEAQRPLTVGWERWGDDMLARARLREW